MRKVISIFLFFVVSLIGSHKEARAVIVGVGDTLLIQYTSPARSLISLEGTALGQNSSICHFQTCQLFTLSSGGPEGGQGSDGAFIQFVNFTEVENPAATLIVLVGSFDVTDAFSVVSGHNIEATLTLNPDPATIPEILPFIAPPIPEPSTWAMLLIGFAALGCMHRRRRLVVITKT